MTERLSDKNPCNNCNVYNPCTGTCGKWHEWNRNVLQKLAEYETAEEEGRLVVLPCDTVYFIWNKSSRFSHVRAKSILDLSLREILGIDKDGRYWSVKEEAEKALKEMEGK